MNIIEAFNLTEVPFEKWIPPCYFHHVSANLSCTRGIGFFIFDSDKIIQGLSGAWTRSQTLTEELMASSGGQHAPSCEST